jgi:hypothetical protein
MPSSVYISSHLLFAGDSKIYCTINNTEVCKTLQSRIESVQKFDKGTIVQVGKTVIICFIHKPGSNINKTWAVQIRHSRSCKFQC